MRKTEPFLVVVEQKVRCRNDGMRERCTVAGKGPPFRIRTQVAAAIWLKMSAYSPLDRQRQQLKASDWLLGYCYPVVHIAHNFKVLVAVMSHL